MFESLTISVDWQSHDCQSILLRVTLEVGAGGLLGIKNKLRHLQHKAKNRVRTRTKTTYVTTITKRGECRCGGGNKPRTKPLTYIGVDYTIKPSSPKNRVNFAHI